MLKLVVKSLKCARGGRLLIPELSFSLSSGRAMIVRGPNGAGKSTLLRAIAGFFRPEAGSVTLEGGDAEKTLAEQCHYIAHANAIKPAMTVEENLAFMAAFYDAPAPDAIDAAIDGLELEQVRYIPAGYLSAGQKRRVALARLIAVKRPVWLLDEPSTSLDARSHKLLMRIIGGHLEGGGIVMAATHTPLDLDPVQAVDLGQSAPAEMAVQ